MNGLNVTPTKSSLLNIKEDLQLAKEGHELLDHKREVLIHELMRLVHELKSLQEDINKKYQHFFSLFKKASVKLGEEKLRLNLNFKTKGTDIDTIFRSVMGIHVPEIHFKQELTGPVISGLDDSCPELQECIKMVKDLFEILIRYIETEASVWRMVVEIKKTQRRVKSLENITIPEYKKTIKVITELLEENEREDFFRMKKIKSKISSS